MPKKKLTLKTAWNKRCKMLAAAEKLHIKTVRFYTEGIRAYPSGESSRVSVKLYRRIVESSRLLAESLKFSTARSFMEVEADLLWVNAILAEFGDIEMKWDVNGSCKLGNGEVYKIPRKRG